MEIKVTCVFKNVDEVFLKSRVGIVEEIKLSFQDSMRQIEAKGFMEKDEALFLLRESFTGILDRTIMRLKELGQ